MLRTSSAIYLKAHIQRVFLEYLLISLSFLGPVDVTESTTPASLSKTEVKLLYIAVAPLATNEEIALLVAYEQKRNNIDKMYFV